MLPIEKGQGSIELCEILRGSMLGLLLHVWCTISIGELVLGGLKVIEECHKGMLVWELV